MGQEDENVIHVQFGGSGRCRLAPAVVPEPRAEQTAPGDPTGELYSIHDVAKLFDLPPTRLRSWDRSGFLRPSAKSGGSRSYTFQDLIGLRAAKGLLEQGVPFRRVRESVEALRASLPRVARPLSELRVQADGQGVVVRDDGALFDPRTGQLVLDFEVRVLREDVVRLLHAPPTPDRKSAYDLYLEGCRLDEGEATLEGAEQAYRRAAEMDPSLSSAFTNLGNLRFRRGDSDEAERLYRKALEVDSSQPEAHYNLGFLCFERGELAACVQHLRAALEHDPSFADAHFNLAMAYEELGRPEDARAHWEAYIQVDPESPWVEIATRHLR